MTLYLTLPPAIASQRSAFGVERYETIAIQTAVREQFGLVAREVKDRHGERRWVEVGAGGSIEEVEERIWALVEGLVGGVEGKKIGDLWVR